MAEIVVPWSGGCPHRERARERLGTALTYTLAPYDEKPWVKARAVMPAIEKSTAEIVVVHDADVWTEGLDQAIQAVEDGADWAMPHNDVVRLTESGTDRWLKGEKVTPKDWEQRPYRGLWGGGIVVARRETLLDVPLDPRFEGWGQEDWCWGTALWHLLSPGWRGAANLIHLWHPPQDRINRRHGNANGVALYRRYRAARGDRTAMEQIVEEARDYLTDKQAVPAGHP